MLHKLDKRDMKILDIIADNARLPYSKIGRLAKISKDRVRERIARMKSQRFILSFIPLINYPSFGYCFFSAYVRFRSTMTREKSFVKLLQNHSRVVSLIKIPERYDFEIEFLARTKTEARDIIKNMGLKSFGEITELCVLDPDMLHIYTMNLNPTSKSKIISLDEKKSQKVKIDELDVKILKLLSVNSREKLVDLSSKLKVNVDTLRYRINRLSKEGVISMFYTGINRHKFNLNSYIFLIKLKRKLYPSEFEIISKKAHIYSVRSFSGKWNLVINFYAENNKGIIDTINYLKNIFKKNLINSELLILLERYFFFPLPKNFSLPSDWKEK